MGRNHRITDWDPEDGAAWDAGNGLIARRNLLWMVACDHIAFGVWTLFPVLALFMPQGVYGFSAADKFLLGATATLVAACLRIPYSLGIATFGGRNWTVFSIVALLVPTAGAIWLLAHPGLPLWPYLVCAALSGMGGANYAASMTNTNFFYPHRRKGFALGLNAGVGNLGVPMIQLVGLLVIAVAGHRQPYWVCGLYLALLTVVAIGASRYMDNLEHATYDVTHLRSILSEHDTWVLALLYLGTFGSWIGFSFAFGQVLQIGFVGTGQTHAQAALHAAELAFIGPALGSVARIYGGRLADRVGGSRVTLAVLAAMGVTTALLIAISTHEDHSPGLTGAGTMVGYVCGFLVLFMLAGLGNGSVYKMIPSVFEARSHRLELSEAERRRWSQATSGAVIGFVAAFGALGGVGINLALRQSYLSTGTDTLAFWAFLAFYITAAVLTWARYVRRPRPASAGSPDANAQSEPARV
ncbi:integral membrane nitrite extrusion protein NarK3 [Mycobacterium bohemicum DSM 44277]|uniref:MFS transporter n=2 Tax=Mycobacterium bohemicum TaxID=56425 RepID=A0A1X1R084_MYCBE|nr:nitrate/nitrite transporter [Mycobacterium bohemicum]MCV6971268.1 NarK/NasA family nitrate transporter [Mycobacterium bohemicum]ORU97292.1 MFS transporter [Mycobacterium bohemicum]CPR01087.1 integral membrane nitrite extrusion protein NarK3 [Mycobacterium bohemicum DSM 44277]